MFVSVNNIHGPGTTSYEGDYIKIRDYGVLIEAPAVGTDLSLLAPSTFMLEQKILFPWHRVNSVSWA